ncbi:pyruvate kinase, partial [Candidatus Bathyarchaeota archaeon]|nr:pyruvate kinase [Candidatus Bathyarchaeota archaeon]
VREEVDWFAASFIRNRNDVEKIKEAINYVDGEQPIISKIEHGEAINNIDEIIEASDGIMVARGDLGIEVPPWEVPLLQKMIISKCNDVGKPVIVATQMLESMVQNPRPTRAEATDVANAIIDGADAVMLSEETAMGTYPVETVEAMSSISYVTESKALLNKQNYDLIEGRPIADTIGSLAAQAVKVVKPSAIFVVTRSGFSSLMVSKHRPKVPILAVTKEEKIVRKMHLYWGVRPLDVQWSEDRDTIILKAVEKSWISGYISRNDTIMVVSSSGLDAPGRTSTLEILKVDEILSHVEKKL